MILQKQAASLPSNFHANGFDDCLILYEIDFNYCETCIFPLSFYTIIIVHYFVFCTIFFVTVFHFVVFISVLIANHEKCFPLINQIRRLFLMK